MFRTPQERAAIASVERAEEMANAIETLREGRKAIDQIIIEYNDFIDDAAMENDDAYSDSLILDQMQLEEFAADLKYLERQLELNAITAEALSKIKGLPKALNKYKKLIKGNVDIGKLGRSMSDLRTSLDKARGELKDLRKVASRNNQSAIDRIRGRNSEEPKRTAKFEEKKKARELRIKNRIDPIHADDVKVKRDHTIDDVDSLFNDENNKD